MRTSVEVVTRRRDHPGEVSSLALRSVATRFGFADGPTALAELGLLQARSAARYRSAEVLPIGQWSALRDALRHRDVERTEALFPGDALLRVGAIAHQRSDEAEAAYRDVSRPRRLGRPASPSQVDEVGHRLLAGDDLSGNDLLLVARFVRAQTTSQGLRRKGVEAVQALCQRHWSSGEVTSSDYGDVLSREALCNLDAGPAAETAIDVLTELATAHACPCQAAREAIYLDSDRGRRLVLALFDSHLWPGHDGLLHAAWKFRLRRPITFLADRPRLNHDVQAVAVRYLSDAVSSHRLTSSERTHVSRLLEETQEAFGEFTAVDRAAVLETSLQDRTGLPLDNDPIVPSLLNRLLLSDTAAECDVAANLLKNLGAAPESLLLQFSMDHALSCRIRTNALAALGVFGTSAAEPAIRLIAANRNEPTPLRVQALWSYQAHGADEQWMYPLLADEDRSIREALMYAARFTQVGVILAGTTDPASAVAELALQEARRLAAEGRLGPFQPVHP